MDIIWTKKYFGRSRKCSLYTCIPAISLIELPYCRFVMWSAVQDYSGTGVYICLVLYQYHTDDTYHLMAKVHSVGDLHIHHCH